MSKKNINVFTPLFRTDEILSEIKECLEKGWTGMGFKTQIFEQKWSEYTGIPYSHFLSSNTNLKIRNSKKFQKPKKKRFLE